MGCFNRTGFISHLPISYQDEIVVFLLADTSRIDYINSIPCYPNSSGYTPLSIPFFGTYDDYGSIEDVRDDFNSRYFQKKVGKSLEEVCQLLLCRNNVGATYRNIVSTLKKLNEPSYNEYGKERDIKEFEELKEIYEKILDIDQNYKKIAEENSEADWECSQFIDSTITFTMELKSVYDKMGEISVKESENDVDYSSYGLEKPSYSLEEKFDNTNKWLKTFANTRKRVNPLTFGTNDVYTLMDVDDLQEMFDNNQLEEIKKLINLQNELHKYSFYDFMGIHTCLSGGAPMPLDYRLFNGCCEDISEMKEDVIKYIYFLNMVRINCVVFTLSPSHGQDIDYDQVITYCEEILNIAKAKKAEKDY